ncbi:MAG: type II secretion system protein [bacterium]|nr:type II secretion system protein [bacterium]
MSHPRKKKGGFTLVETIVSLALLSFAVAGPMTLAAHSIKASGAAKNELIATHLAEEGLEVVRNLRDNSSAEDNGDRDGLGEGFVWMQNIFGNCKFAWGCAIDITQHVPSGTNGVWSLTPPNRYNAIILCPGNCAAESVVYFNPGTGLYRQSENALGSPWVRTQFTRTIFMTGIDDPNEPERQVRVTAVVTYAGYGGIIRTIRVTQDVYNWFPYLP